MSALQQLLLLPLLSPLLAVLLLAAVNPRPPVALRVLVWSTPALPLGAWIAAAAAAGAGLSGAATALALRQGQGGRPERSAAAAAAAAPRRQASGGPSRAAGEPPPTVEVPFRVIRRAPAASGVGEARVVSDGWDEPLSSTWD